jgi:hypothetical protein
MKYVVKMGSDAVIHILNFIKSGSAIQKLVGRNPQVRRHAESMEIV